MAGRTWTSTNRGPLEVARTVTGLAVKETANGGFVIGKARVGRRAAFNIRYAIAAKKEIKGGPCFECKAESTVFMTASKRLGVELARITYTCAACGHQEVDMAD